MVDVKRFLRAYGLICFLAVAVAFALTYALAPNLVAAPWRAYKEATKGWHVLHSGPTRGIALLMESATGSLDYPSEIAKPTSASGLGVGTLHFIVKLPIAFKPQRFYDSESKGPRAVLITPEGDETPMVLYGGFADRSIATAMVRPEYRPDCPYLDLRIEVPGYPNTTFRLTRLTQTKDFFSRHAPLESTSVAGLTVEGEAFLTSPAKPGYLPALTASTRVTSLPPGQRWEWRDLGLSLPFGLQAASTAPGRFAYASVRPMESLGDEVAAPFGKQYRLARISGSLARYEEVQEDVDFGMLPIKPATEFGREDDHKFRLDIKSPVTRQTPSGFRISLEPEGAPPSFENQTCDWSFVCLILKPEVPLSTGFAGKDNDVRLAVSWDGKFFEEVPLTRLNARDVPGQMMMTSKLEKTSKTVRVKLRLQRKRYLETHSLELFLPIRRAAASNAYPLRGEEVVGTSRWPELRD